MAEKETSLGTMTHAGAAPSPMSERLSGYGKKIVQVGCLITVLILPLIFDPTAAHTIEATKIAFFCGMALGMAALFLALAASSRRPLSLSWRENPLVIPVLFYGLVWILATLNSPNPSGSFWGVSDSGGLVPEIMLLVSFGLWTRALQSEKQLERLISAMLLGSVPIVLYGLTQALGLDPLNWRTDSISSVLSTLGRSTTLGSYLAMLVPFTMTGLFKSTNANAQRRYAILLTLQVVCLWLTQARGAWLGFLVGSLIYLGIFAVLWRSRLLAMVAIFVLLLGSALFFAMNKIPWTPGDHSASVSNMTSSELRQASVDKRMIIWRSTLPLIGERWLLGYGPGIFMDVFQSRYPVGSLYEGTDTLVDDPQNLFLSVLVNAGVLGLLAFGSLLAVTYAMLYQIIRAARERSRQFVSAAVLAAVTAFLIQGQFNPISIALWVPFWVCLVIGSVLFHWSKRAGGEQAVSSQVS